MEVILKIAVVLFSIIIHEISHGYAALALGDKTAKLAGRLTLNPIKHIDPFGTVILPILLAIVSQGQFFFGWAKPVPYNPYNLSNQKWGDAIVSVAGPASNILVATVFSLVLHSGLGINQAFNEMLVFIIFMNVVLALFNLVPIPPLDGSKILFSFLPYKYIHIKHILERYGFVLLVFFIFFLWDFFVPYVIWVANLFL